MERRLACILAADVVGYSRLMEADEEDTLAALKIHRGFIDDRISNHQGRVFGSAGDSVIAEFASPVEAVRCAVEIQQELETRNSELPEDGRMLYRVGINLGDVIVDGDNLYGVGVNIAARLEQIADPGSVCISGTVYDHLAGKLNLVLNDLGEQQLKNISQRVRVWHWSTEGAPMSPSRGVYPLLPEKPSIAVLPFKNMSGILEQEYFSDGITEDITTDLSKVQNFYVLPRNSSFAYRDESIDWKRVADELNAQFLVKGSVRREGEMVRITAQLIDAVAGKHIWAKRYDRNLKDIFAVQDEITHAITAAIAPEILTAEIHRALHKDERNLGAWDNLMRAYWHTSRVREEDNAKAKRYALRSAELDPANSRPVALYANALVVESIHGWGEPREWSLQEARRAAIRAVELDDHDSQSFSTLGLVSLYDKRFDDAAHFYRQEIELAPNEADGYAMLGVTLGYTGDYESACRYIDRAKNLSPRDIFTAVWHMHLALSAAIVARDEEAIELAQRAIRVNPGIPGTYRTLAACYANLGRIEEAREALAILRKLCPKVTISFFREQLPIKEISALERYLEGLCKAGLPE